MKSKKIISLTIFAVVLVLAGILGLSKVFENGWQNESTVDNSLNVDKSNLYQEEVVFNYPFKVIENSNTISENSISYQDAANIAGEAIKFLSGITDHQKIDAEIEYKPVKRFLYEWDESLNHYNSNKNREIYRYNAYEYGFCINFGPDENNIPFFIRVDCMVDAETGEIKHIYFEDYSKCGFNEELRNKSFLERDVNTNISQEECNNILDSVYQFLEILRIENKPVKYHVEEYRDPRGFVYMISLLMDNGYIYEMGITNDDAIVNKDSLFYFDIGPAPEEYYEWTVIE